MKLLVQTFLTAEWRHLLMINYTADANTLAPLIPRGTELDTWNGRPYITIVGFLFLDTRVFGVAIPWNRDFPEVNLRFYVRRRGPEGWRRGVVFVREIVPRRAVATIARLFYNEPYMTMPMKYRVETTAGSVMPGSRLEYSWRHHGRWNCVAGRVRTEPGPVVEGSEAEFVTEHHWGYTRRRDDATNEYRVEHPRWKVADVAEPKLDADVADLYGPEFVNVLSGPPVSAHVATGSPVRVGTGATIA